MNLSLKQSRILYGLICCSIGYTNVAANALYSNNNLGVYHENKLYHSNQLETITGKITDEKGNPLKGISVKYLDNTVLTDSNGYFTIDAPIGASLEFSGDGFETFQANSTAESMLITLSTSSSSKVNEIAEVVLVGYTSQKKNSISGAVSSVDMKDLSKTHVGDVAQALQGQVPGVVVSANTGAPGDGIKVRVRGETTFGASNDALYVVDGVPTRDISFLNPNDIQSMSVLKDASAAAIYGSRSAGGVVIITTKSGSKSRMSIDVDMFSGFNFASNLPEMLNTDQYLRVKDMAWHNTFGNSQTALSPYETLRRNGEINGIKMADTNWQKELFNTGKTDNIQLTASGGSENIQYLISGGLYNQDGIIIGDNDNYKRYNFRSNINANLSDRFKVGTNAQISYAIQDKLSSSGDEPGIIRHALIRPPVLSVYKDPNDPTYNPNNPFTDLPFYTNSNGGWSRDFEYSSNPLAIVHFTNDKRKTFQTFGNIFGEYAFLRNKDLKLRSSLGVDIAFSHNKNFGANYGDSQISDTTNQYFGFGRNNMPNSLNENRGESMTFTWSNTLNYIKTLNDVHSLNLLVGSEYITNKASAIGGSRTNYINTNPEFQYLDYGNTSLNVWSSGSATSWSLMSYFGSATYGYDNKYFVSGTFRADASSRFGPNNKWGYFPSVSGAWVVSNEEFLRNSESISNLKLRASYGKSGNQEIPDFQWYNLYTIGVNPQLIRIGNPDIRWETTTQTNFGADLGLFGNKLTLTADYFEKVTDDILLPVVPPGLIGSFAATSINSGKVTNKGFEFGVGLKNYSNEFKYSINGNFSTLKNNVDELYTYVANIIDDATHTKTVVGQPISSYFGYVFDGIYQNANEISSHLGSYNPNSGTQPGDIKFKDLNGDGQINADDRTIIGNPIPKYTYGLNASFEYKGFDFSFMIQGVEDVDRYNDLKQILNYDSRPFNSTTAVLNAWNGEGSTNTTPRLTFNDNGGSKVSSIFVEDASYVRLKNIELGYNFKPEFLGVKNLRLYVSGQNLLTFTDYTGLDPESTSLIDKGTYPQSKAFLFGIKVKL